MEKTNDIDANGYWTIDNYEALMGLAAYRWLAQQVGDTGRGAAGPPREYASLLAATNKTLDATISANHLNYLPCSMTEPNTGNRCANAEDANWAAPFLFGRWAWDGYLFGAPLQRARHQPDRRHLRLRLRPPGRASCRRTRSAATRRSTTAPPTTPGTASGAWPAAPTGTRASSATSS